MNILDRFRAYLFDLIHDVDTVEKVPLEKLNIVAGQKDAGHFYFPTLPKSMDSVLRSLQRIDFSSNTFIDIGCGKGLTLLIAARYPFRRIVGVEFAVELCNIARSNVQSYRGRLVGPLPEIVCDDATSFVFPLDPLVVYFFNPFSDTIMAQVLANLRSSFEQSPRPIAIVCDRLHNTKLFGDMLQPDRQTEVIGFAVYWLDMETPC